MQKIILLLLTIVFIGCESTQIQDGKVTTVVDEFENSKTLEMFIMKPETVKVNDGYNLMSMFYMRTKKNSKFKPTRITFNFSGPVLSKELSNKAMIKVDKSIFKLKFHSKIAKVLTQNNVSYYPTSQTTSTSTTTKNNQNGISSNNSFGSSFGNSTKTNTTTTETKTTNHSYQAVNTSHTYMYLKARVHLTPKIERMVLKSKNVSFRFYSGIHPLTIKLSNKELKYIKNFLIFTKKNKKKK